MLKNIFGGVYNLILALSVPVIYNDTECCFYCFYLFSWELAIFKSEYNLFLGNFLSQFCKNILLSSVLFSFSRKTLLKIFDWNLEWVSAFLMFFIHSPIFNFLIDLFYILWTFCNYILHLSLTVSLHPSIIIFFNI